MVSALYNKVAGTKRSTSVPARKPWREVGWIFRDGEIIAIERQGHQTRMRSAQALA